MDFLSLDFLSASPPYLFGQRKSTQRGASRDACSLHLPHDPLLRPLRRSPDRSLPLPPLGSHRSERSLRDYSSTLRHPIQAPAPHTETGRREQDLDAHSINGPRCTPPAARGVLLAGEAREADAGCCPDTGARGCASGRATTGSRREREVQGAARGRSRGWSRSYKGASAGEEDFAAAGRGAREDPRFAEADEIRVTAC